jgi:hypothetical protein
VARDAGRLPQARRDCVRSLSGHFQLVERTVSANNVVRLVPHDPPTTVRWTKRDHGRNGKLAHRCFPLRRIASRPGYWLEFLVALAVVAVAQRRLGPSSSASTSTVDRALPSSAVQARWWSRPTTTTRLPLLSELSKILAAAVEGGMIPRSPCRQIPLPRIERAEMRF